MARTGNHGVIVPQDAALLRRLHWTERRTVTEIGRIYGVSPVSVQRAMRKVGVPTKSVDAASRFWFNVDRDSSNTGCWTWLGCDNGVGYGVFSVNGRMTAAHRFAWELLVGKIPDGLTIDHLCRNTACVNPSHMEPVTNRENILRGTSPSAIRSRATHCVRGHQFDAANTRVTQEGWRRCRACDRAQKRKAYSSVAAKVPQ